MSQYAILECLVALNSGRRTFENVTTFLTKRTATAGVGTIGSDTLTVPNKGTQQGSVNSPLLFNVAVTGLAQKLQKFEGI